MPRTRKIREGNPHSDIDHEIAKFDRLSAPFSAWRKKGMFIKPDRKRTKNMIGSGKTHGK